MARGRLRMAIGSSPDGLEGRLRMATGRLRTARGSPFKLFTDGGSSGGGDVPLHIKMAVSGRLLKVGCLRIAQLVRVPAVSPPELTGPGAVDVQNPVEIPLLQALDKVVGMPVDVQRQVPTVQTAENR